MNTPTSERPPTRRVTAFAPRPGMVSPNDSALDVLTLPPVAAEITDPDSLTPRAVEPDSTWLGARAMEVHGLSPSHLEHASILAKNRRLPLADALEHMDLLSAWETQQLFVAHYGLPAERSAHAYLPLAPALRALAPLSTLTRCMALPVALLPDQTVRLLVADPFLAQEVVDHLAHRGHWVELRIARRADLRTAIEAIAQERVLISQTEHAGPRMLMTSLVSAALGQRASDIHFEPLRNGAWIKFRVDGKLQPFRWVDGKHERDTLVSQAKMAGGLDVGTKLEPLDAETGYIVQGRMIRCRFSSLPTVHGESVVVRLLDQESALVDFEALGCTPRQQEALQGLVRETEGIVFFVGPTGSGKTSTLRTIVNRLDRFHYSTFTLENPVENQINGVRHTSTSDHLSFGTGLRAMLRQDPDFILIGEIRDSESAKLAVEAALTGHLVFSTLHGNDAGDGLARLLELGVELGLLSSALRQMVAQRLVARLCSHCAEEIPEGARLTALRKLAKLGPRARFWDAHRPGCEHCLGGYKGRLGIFEILDFRSEALQSVLVENAASPGVVVQLLKRLVLRDPSHLTLFDDGMAKAARGLTTIDEVLQQVSDPRPTFQPNLEFSTH